MIIFKFVATLIITFDFFRSIYSMFFISFFPCKEDNRPSFEFGSWLLAHVIFLSLYSFPIIKGTNLPFDVIKTPILVYWVSDMLIFMFFKSRNYNRGGFLFFLQQVLLIYFLYQSNWILEWNQI